MIISGLWDGNTIFVIIIVKLLFQYIGGAETRLTDQTSLVGLKINGATSISTVTAIIISPTSV